MKFTLSRSNFWLIWLLSWQVSYGEAIPHYYCTAADERHYVLLLNLIGSIHKNDFADLAEIAIFDLGLSSTQKNYLSAVKKVRVYAVELVHPDLLTYFVTSPQGRKVRGWFAWKPVVIKQALDLFPYVLYLDAGATVLHSPQNLFKHIIQQGYFLIDTGPHAIAERATKTVISKLIDPLLPAQKTLLLNPQTLMISPGLQGLSRMVYDSYVLPTYMAAKDLTLFADDGTCPLGFGAARHDQPVFSIYAYLNKLHIHPQGWANVLVDGALVKQHIHWDRREINDQTVIYQSRWHYRYKGGNSQYIQ